ncbi:protein angel [Drosophila persimilis]|uniref:protein angel n=1 Tax=Drosophila persimilis TaxID=7234 RepID=UPI000F09679E|nr:protein angel [Drosophila persimilis]
MYKFLLRSLPGQASFIRTLGVSTAKHRSSRRNESSDQIHDAMDRYDRNRQWRRTKDGHGHGHVSKDSSFKVVSYNILAQDLLVEHFYLYGELRTDCLTWRRRLQNIQREILTLDPDILCLQEMQYDHIFDLMQGLRVGNGKKLEYVYKKKTGERTDGCAIIYDACKFQLLDQRPIEFYDQNVKLLNRENVALFAKLGLKGQTEKEFIVATTHLLYNPKRDDVRCAQVTRLLEELETFSCDPKSGQVTPIVLTGDFNSVPNSPPFEIITADSPPAKLLNFKVVEMGPPGPKGPSIASTRQDNWITVDYILRSLSDKSQHQLQVTSIYGLPTVNVCYHVGPIPNHYLGSDHYALGVVFNLI